MEITRFSAGICSLLLMLIVYSNGQFPQPFFPQPATGSFSPPSFAPFNDPNSQQAQGNPPFRMPFIPNIFGPSPPAGNRPFGSQPGNNMDPQPSRYVPPSPLNSGFPDPASVVPYPESPGSVFHDPRNPSSVFPNQQNPGSVFPNQQNPGSIFPNEQNPGSIFPNQRNPGSVFPNQQNPGSIFQNPQNPNSFIPNPPNPTSLFPNPQNPGSFFPNPPNLASVFPNPQSPGSNYPNSESPVSNLPNPPNSGPGPSNPQSPGSIPPNDQASSVPNPQSPGSGLSNPQNPASILSVDQASSVPNPQSPGSGLSNPQNPASIPPDDQASSVPNPQSPGSSSPKDQSPNPVNSGSSPGLQSSNLNPPGPSIPSPGSPTSGSGQILPPGHKSHIHRPRISPLKDPLGGLRIVCLFNSKHYYRDGFSPELIDPSLCTHVNYEFAMLDPKTYEMMTGEPDLDVEQGFFETVIKLKDWNEKLKVLLSLGGWQDSTRKYSEMADDATKRANFIEKAISFLKSHGFDGLDLAWEYPNCWQGAIGVSPKDKQNFVTLLKEMKPEFEKNNLILSISVGAIKREVEAAYDVPEVSANVDYINVMTYDMHGPWESKTGHHTQFEEKPGDSDPYSNVVSAMKLWAEKGAEKKKLNMGLALYGKSFTLEDPNKFEMGAPAVGVGDPGPKSGQGGFLLYNEICELLDSGNWTEKEDKKAGYYAYWEDQWACYDPPMMMVKKTKHVVESGYGGVLLKDLSGDDYLGNCFSMPFPLLKMVNLEMIQKMRDFYKGTSTITLGKLSRNPLYADLTPWFEIRDHRDIEGGVALEPTDNAEQVKPLCIPPPLPVSPEVYDQLYFSMGKCRMEPKPWGQRIVETIKKVSVEPFIFLVMFAYNVRLISMQSMLHDKACRISLKLPDEICDALDTDENVLEQTAAVTYGNNLYNGLVMISTLPAIVVATFLGPWSDRYSRKYPLLLASSGIFIDMLIQAIITSVPGSSPFWYLVSANFSGLSGGLIMILSSTYSYMSDITDERSRQTRYAILEFFTLMATPTGSFLGGKIYAAGKYQAVMITGACAMGLAVLWLWLYVVETKPRRFDITRKQMFQDVLKVDNLKESYKTCIKPRPGNLRLQIWLLVLVSFSLRFNNLGTVSIGFSYTRRVFKWGVERYSYTNTLFSLLNGIATLVIVPILNRKLLVHEAAVGLIGILSLMAKMVLLSVSIYEWLIFYAWFSGSLYACGGIALRSRVSKLVSRNELGKVFSLFAMCESATPVLGTAVFIQIYNSSVNFYPGLAYALAAAMLIPSAIIFAWMMYFPSMSFSQYQETEEAKNMKELKNVSTNVF